MAKRPMFFKQRKYQDEAETPKRDSPLIKKRILEFSESRDFEEARREWEFTRIIEETEDAFVDHCEICNSPLQKRNFEIANQYSGKKYLVGSTCIRKFILLGGAETQEESSAIFDTQLKKQDAAKMLQALLPSILTEPTPRELHRFSQTAKFILDAKDNKDVISTSWKNFIRLLFGKNPPKNEIVQRISTSIFSPSHIKTRKVAMATGQKEGQWANITKVKKNKGSNYFKPIRCLSCGKRRAQREIDDGAFSNANLATAFVLSLVSVIYPSTSLSTHFSLQ